MPDRVAHFADGTLTFEWKSYVDPEDYFDALNVSIHGIDEEVVAGAPTLKGLADQINALLVGRVVITHTHFDRVAIYQAAGKCKIAPPECTWLNSARVARRAWSELSKSGYGLASVCQRIGYEFQHHDALEDAKAAAQVMVAAIAETGLDVEGWLRRVRQPLDLSKAAEIAREGNPDGPLFRRGSSIHGCTANREARSCRVGSSNWVRGGHECNERDHTGRCGGSGHTADRWSQQKQQTPEGRGANPEGSTNPYFARIRLQRTRPTIDVTPSSVISPRGRGGGRNRPWLYPVQPR